MIVIIIMIIVVYYPNVALCLLVPYASPPKELSCELSSHVTATSIKTPLVPFRVRAPPPD